MKYKTIRGIIPRWVSNKIVLGALELLRRLTNRIPAAARERNLRENSGRLLEAAVFSPGCYIENQAQWGNIRFGSGRHSCMAYSGCEIIAVCNALLALGEKTDAAGMAELISFYEKDGALLNGDFGTSPRAIFRFFQKRGYRVRGTSSRKADILDAFGGSAATFIVTVWNDCRDIMAQIHTVCLTKNAQGRFVVHNAYQRREGRFVQKDAEGRGYGRLTEAIAAIHPGAAPIYTIALLERQAG